MKSMLKKMVAVFCLMIAMVATVEAQNSFAYQAVIRKANGDVVSEKKVSMCFSLIYNNEEVYVETQSPMTDRYGNVQVEIGKGYKVIGDFSKVPWHTMQVMMRIEVDPDGGHNFIDLGAIQLQPAPYAMHAASTGLVIDSSSPKSGSGALFEVKDKDGNVVFAVFPDGVRVYVDDSDGKPVQTGFAVAGRRAAKDGEEANLFSVTSEGTQVIVDDADGKAMSTGFAVAGRRAAKDGESDLFTVSSTGTQVYINTDADGKPVQTGFAVAGRRAAKDGGTEKYLEINESGTQVYIDDEADGKPVQTGFAVAGRRAAKGSNDNKYMEVTADGTTVYVDTDGKAMSTGFAVAGRRAAKGKNLKLFQVNRYGTHIFIDEDADDKPVQTGFAVAGRRAAKDEEAKKYMVIDAEGTFIYVDYEDAKAMQTGFAVAGRRAAKDGTPSSILTVNGQEGTHVYIDDADGKAMSTGFAVAGRRAAKEKSFKLFQVTSLGSSMTTGHFSVGNTALDDKVLSVSAGASVIKTNEFVLADETKPTEGEQAVAKSVFQAKSGEGVTIAEESQVVVKGDVGRAIMTEPLMAGNGIELPGSIIVDNRIVDTLCSEYAEVLGEPDGYKLLKIHGKGLFTINDNYDLNGNAVIMFNKSGKVTYSSKSAVLAVIMTSPDMDETGESKLVFWPCCPISDTLKIKFGLMAAGTTDTYLEVEAIVYPTDGVSRVKYIADPKMGTIKSDIVPFYGSKASFTAEAKKGYEFERWIVQTKQVNGEEGRFNEEGEWNEYYKNPLTLAIGWDSIYLEAEFMPIQIGYFAHPENGGEIEVRQKCDGCVTNIGNIQVKVEYTTIAKGNKGFITADQMPEVDSLTFVAQPKPGYKFICWNGKEELTDSIITVKVDQSMELVAFFEGEGQQSESDNNTIGTKDNHSNNQWHVVFFPNGAGQEVTNNEFGFIEDEGAYVKFKAGDGFTPYCAQFNNILKGLPNQVKGNWFTLSFEAMWVPDEEVYGDDAPGAAKIYMKTGKNPDYSSSSTGYQWKPTNTELLYRLYTDEFELYRQYCPKLMNNEWNSYAWEATIGEAGDTYNEEYGMGAQIGIEMDLIDGQPGHNSGTFWFRNIEVYMGGEVVAQYFMVDVPEQQRQQYRTIEIIEPYFEGEEPMISLYSPDGEEIDYSYTEKVEIDGEEYRSSTYFSQIGGNFTFATENEALGLREYMRGAFSKVIDTASFNDVEYYKVDGSSWAYNERKERHEREVTLSLDNIFVADYFDEENDNGGKATIDIKVTGYGEVEITEVDSNNDIVQQYTLIGGQNGSYECIIGNSVYLNADAENYNFYGWFNDDGNMVVSSRGDDGSIIPVADYSFGVSEDTLFVARFAEEEQQENNGDKATIQIQTNGEVGLYKILDLNGNSEGIDPTDSLELVDNATSEVTGYIYTYECNVGDSIQLLANVHTTETFYGWYGNYADTEFDELTDDSFSSEWLLGNVTMVPEYSYEYSFKVTKTTNRFVAIFDEEEQQPTGATIQVKTNGEIQLTVDGKSLEVNETQEGDGYTTYTFTCEKGDNVTFTAIRGKREEFMGWWDEEYFNRYDYHYQDEPYMGKGDIIIEEGDFGEDELKKKTEEFHEQHCVGGFTGEYPDYVYNLMFDFTIVEDSYTFIADFYTISSETIDGVAYSITDEDAKTCKVSSVDKELATINIPAKVSIGGEEFSVTSIGKRSFDYCKCSEVIIPEGVTTIEGDAFYFCNNITSLSLPNTISFVGYFAFRGGFDNFQYYKENGVSYLGNSENPYVVLMDYNYNNNPNTNIVIPEGCCYIYQSAFYNTVYSGERPIGGVTIPNTVKGIGYNAFYSQTITTLDIPEGVTYIDEMAFYSCSNLTSVSIPSSLDYVGRDAFYFEANDLSYYIDGNAKYLGNKDNNYVYLVQATQNDITSCEINDNCKLIGTLAFSECTSLSSVTIPGSVKSIGSSAFYGCTGLANLDVPEGVKSIGYNAFDGVVNINYYGELDDHDNWGAQTRNCLVDGGFAYSDDTKTTLVKYIGTDDAVIIPNTVKTIGARAFYCDYGTKLKTLTIPSSVTTIGSYAFYGILNVVYEGTAEPNESYDGENWGAQNLNAPMDENFIYADAGKTQILQFIGTVAEIDIPNTVTVIAQGAFSGAEITSVNIPSSVTEIGESAFSYCDGLTSVSIPASVTKIGEDAFRESGLESAKFASVADLCKIAFANESSNPMYPYEYAEVELYFGNDEEPITNLEIPELDTIGQYAFYNCKQLESVSIPASVWRIGDNAFGRCENISKMTIAEPSNGNGLQGIGYKAFNQCAFSTIILPNTLTTIGNNAFDDCDNLVSVVIPESVTTMGSYVFSYIENDVVIFCLETNDDNNASRFDSWKSDWDNANASYPDVKVAVVKENRKTEQPNIVRGNDGLLYFVYNGSNLNESPLKYLITIRNNVTFQNGDAFAVGYHGTRSQSLSLVVPATVGSNNPVVAIARNAFYGENLTYFTLGSDGSKGSTQLQSNIKIIGKGAFCGITSDYEFFTQISNWGKYSTGGGITTNERLDGYLTADELKQNSCNSEYYVDE